MDDQTDPVGREMGLEVAVAEAREPVPVRCVNLRHGPVLGLTFKFAFRLLFPGADPGIDGDHAFRAGGGRSRKAKACRCCEPFGDPIGLAFTKLDAANTGSLSLWLMSAPLRTSRFGANPMNA
jgi:hypothetical protein